MANLESDSTWEIVANNKPISTTDEYKHLGCKLKDGSKQEDSFMIFRPAKGVKSVTIEHTASGEINTIPTTGIMKVDELKHRYMEATGGKRSLQLYVKDYKLDQLVFLSPTSELPIEASRIFAESNPNSDKEYRSIASSKCSAEITAYMEPTATSKAPSDIGSLPEEAADGQGTMEEDEDKEEEKSSTASRMRAEGQSQEELLKVDLHKRETQEAKVIPQDCKDSHTMMDSVSKPISEPKQAEVPLTDKSNIVFSELSINEMDTLAKSIVSGLHTSKELQQAVKTNKDVSKSSEKEISNITRRSSSSISQLSIDHSSASEGLPSTAQVGHSKKDKAGTKKSQAVIFKEHVPSMEEKQAEDNPAMTSPIWSKIPWQGRITLARKIVDGTITSKELLVAVEKARRPSNTTGSLKTSGCSAKKVNTFQKPSVPGEEGSVREVDSGDDEKKAKAPVSKVRIDIPSLPVADKADEKIKAPAPVILKDKDSTLEEQSEKVADPDAAKNNTDDKWLVTLENLSQAVVTANKTIEDLREKLTERKAEHKREMRNLQDVIHRQAQEITEMKKEKDMKEEIRNLQHVINGQGEEINEIKKETNMKEQMRNLRLQDAINRQTKEINKMKIEKNMKANSQAVGIQTSEMEVKVNSFECSTCGATSKGSNPCQCEISDKSSTSLSFYASSEREVSAARFKRREESAARSKRNVNVDHTPNPKVTIKKRKYGAADTKVDLWCNYKDNDEKSEFRLNTDVEENSTKTAPTDDDRKEERKEMYEADVKDSVYSLHVNATTNSKKTAMGDKFGITLEIKNTSRWAFQHRVTLIPEGISSFFQFDGFQEVYSVDKTKIAIFLHEKQEQKLFPSFTVPFGVSPGDYTFTWKLVDVDSGLEIGPRLVLNQTLILPSTTIQTNKKQPEEKEEEKVNWPIELGLTDQLDQIKEEKVNRLAEFGFTDREKVIKTFEQCNWALKDAIEMFLARE